MKFTHHRRTRLLSALLILLLFVSLCSCQPPDYGDPGSTSDVSGDASTDAETKAPKPNPFGSSTPYTPSVSYYNSDIDSNYSLGIWFYGKYIYTLHSYNSEKNIIVRTDRETNQQDLACMHEKKAEKCYFCDSEYNCKNLWIDGNVLYTTVYKPSDPDFGNLCVYQDLESGTFNSFALPCSSFVSHGYFFVSDGYVYYNSVGIVEDNGGDTVNSNRQEFSRIPIGGTEREILFVDRRVDYMYNGSLYIGGSEVIDMQTGEFTNLLQNVGTKKLSYTYLGNTSYLAYENPDDTSYKDLYRLDLETGEYEKLLEKIGEFCIMEDGIYYRVPGEYESKYEDTSGKHPSRSERDLYRCDLDGKNAEVVFSDPDVEFLDLYAVIDGYAYGMMRIYSSAKSKKNAYFAYHLASGTYKEIIPYSDPY